MNSVLKAAERGVPHHEKFTKDRRKVTKKDVIRICKGKEIAKGEGGLRRILFILQENLGIACKVIDGEWKFHLFRVYLC